MGSKLSFQHYETLNVPRCLNVIDRAKAIPLKQFNGQLPQIFQKVYIFVYIYIVINRR